MNTARMNVRASGASRRTPASLRDARLRRQPVQAIALLNGRLHPRPVGPEMPDRNGGHDEAGDPADGRKKCPDAESCANAHGTRGGIGSLTLPPGGTEPAITVTLSIAAAGRGSMAGVLRPAFSGGRRSPAAGGASADRYLSVNVISRVTRTGTAFPSLWPGLKRHCLTALIAS